MGEKVNGFEILMDNGGVTVPIQRYDELLKKEAALEMIENLYRSKMEIYDYKRYLSMIFGERQKRGDDNAE